MIHRSPSAIRWLRTFSDRNPPAHRILGNRLACRTLLAIVSCSLPCLAQESPAQESLGHQSAVHQSVGQQSAVQGHSTVSREASGGERAQTTTFLVVRHAEREGNLDQLSAQGEKRAEAIAGLGQTLKVAAIYSTNTQRTKSTALPLAKALKLQTQLYGRISEEWLNEITANYAGKVVLIVGHSNTTGVIAAKLAGEKKSFAIGHDEYDSLFVITKSEATAHCVRLKYGRDSTGAPAADADKMAPAAAHSPEQ